jgi:hypothetical protein
MVKSVVGLRFTASLLRKSVALGLIVVAVTLFVSPRVHVRATYSTEYEKYVHTYINSGVLGNWTYEEKPGFPVLINDSQIMLGQNWSIVCPLLANASYHVYLYGEYINVGPDPKTDYEIYVYDYLGEMEGYHTPSAGFPAHLGTDGSAFFVPKYTGNYTFVIKNDLRESKAAEQATFMIIEDVESNVWHEQYVEGKDSNSLPVLNTSWASEFVTESQLVELYVKVPKTLDMYEARLYMMSDSSSKNQTVLDGIPLAWEPGLYGVRSNGTNVIGGYNLDSEEYRGNAYGSCEYYGQDMFLNFTSPSPGKNLYHLVFIGEVGYGTIDFLVRTEFNNTSLEPLTVPTRAYPDNVTTIAYTSNSTDLQNAILQYSTNGWRSMNSVGMEISNRTCEANIPKQTAGTVVSYAVTAKDVLENILNTNGSYLVKYLSTLNLTSVPMETRLGENVTLSGSFTPEIADVPIVIYVSSENETRQIQSFTLQDGTFVASFKPDTVGAWFVYAEFNGSSSTYDSESLPLTIQVDEPLYTQYSFYILGGVGAITAIGLVVYVKKSKG